MIVPQFTLGFREIIALGYFDLGTRWGFLNRPLGVQVLWKGVRRVHNRAGDPFRLAAYSLDHDQSPMGDFLRRMKSKMDAPAATTATAHKIAIIFYTMVKKQVEYDASLCAQRDTEREKRFESKLKRQARQPGYGLVPIEEKYAA
jgi:transposase